MNSKAIHAGTLVPAFSTPSAKPSSVPAGQILSDDHIPLRLKTIAQLLNISDKTVRRWFQKGLRSSKLGGLRVVKKQDLASFLDDQDKKSNKERS